LNGGAQRTSISVRGTLPIAGVGVHRIGGTVDGKGGGLRTRAKTGPRIEDHSYQYPSDHSPSFAPPLPQECVALRESHDQCRRLGGGAPPLLPPHRPSASPIP